VVLSQGFVLQIQLSPCNLQHTFSKKAIVWRQSIKLRQEATYVLLIQLIIYLGYYCVNSRYQANNRYQATFPYSHMAWEQG